MSSSLSGLAMIPSGVLVMPGPVVAGQALRIGEACAATFDPRVTGLARPVGSMLFSRDGTVAYQKTSNTDRGWTIVGVAAALPGTVAAVRAAAILGASIDSVVGTDFENDTWYSTALVGTGSVVPTTDRGGVLLLSTGATSSTAAIRAHGSGAGGPLIVANMNTDLWYMRARMQLTTAIDAAASCGVFLSNSGTGNPYAFMGVLGAASIAFWILQVTTNGGVTTNLVSAVAIDTNWHTFESWNTGAAVFFAIDGATQGSIPIVNLGTNGGQPYAWAANGGTAANRAIKLDKLAYAFVGQ